jgi:hypothetical protein
MQILKVQLLLQVNEGSGDFDKCQTDEYVDMLKAVSLILKKCNSCSIRKRSFSFAGMILTTDVLWLILKKKMAVETQWVVVCQEWCNSIFF